MFFGGSAQVCARVPKQGSVKQLLEARATATRGARGAAPGLGLSRVIF